jgi:ERCC4-type nuclease
MNQSNMLNIIIDTRERKLMKILDEKKDIINYTVEQLDIADIIISDDVAIERKEGSDFVSSIMDNRLFEQMMRLKETYAKPILILEGLNDNVFENTGMQINSIYGALCKVSYVMGISVVPTRSLHDTVIAIERIAFREQSKGIETILSRKAPKSMSTEDRRAFIIEGLIDSGPKKAKELIAHFKTPFNVLKAIRNTKIIFTKNGNPKGIEGPLAKLSGYGWKFVQKNKEILFGIKDTNPQKSLDEI